MDKEAYKRQKQDLDIDLMQNISTKKMLRTTFKNLDLSHELFRGAVYELETRRTDLGVKGHSKVPF